MCLMLRKEDYKSYDESVKVCCNKGCYQKNFIMFFRSFLSGISIKYLIANGRRAYANIINQCPTTILMYVYGLGMYNKPV